MAFGLRNSHHPQQIGSATEKMPTRNKSTQIDDLRENYQKDLPQKKRTISNNYIHDVFIYDVENPNRTD